MAWLHPFAAMVLCCGAAAALLSKGGLKRTAMMVMGFLITLCWMDSVGKVLRLPESPPAPATVLTETAASAVEEEALAVYARQLARQVEDALGVRLQMTLGGDGEVLRVMTDSVLTPEKVTQVCTLLGIAPDILHMGGG